MGLRTAILPTLALVAWFLLVPPSPRAEPPASGPDSSDSATFPSPDATAGAPSRADSILVVSLDKDEQFVAARVERHGRDYIRVIRSDGRASFVPVARVLSIRDLSGREWTRAVLDDWETVGTAPDVPVRTTPPGLSFTGRPWPGARWFLVTHSGLAARVDAGSPLYEKGKAYALADFGAMRNLGERWAVGGNLYVGADDRRLRFGPKARLRYWLGSAHSIDAAAGVLLAGVDEWKGDADFPGYVGEVNVSLEEVLLLTAEVETVHIRDQNGIEDTDTSWYLGGKLGGVAGIVGVAAALIAVAATHAVLGDL